MTKKPIAVYKLEPRRKYTFGETQNAETAKGGRIIVPAQVASDPRAWLNKSFPVKAFSLDRLGWYRAANHAQLITDGFGAIIQRNGHLIIKIV